MDRKKWKHTGPVLWPSSLNSPPKIVNLIFPVVEGEAGHGLDPQQVAAKYILCPKFRLEGLALLEVLKELNTGGGLPDGVLRGVGGPDKLLAGAEGLVSQRHRRVDDVLAVPAHNNKSE